MAEVREEEAAQEILRDLGDNFKEVIISHIHNLYLDGDGGYVDYSLSSHDLIAERVADLIEQAIGELIASESVA